jgi:hypothetical protein
VFGLGDRIQKALQLGGNLTELGTLTWSCFFFVVIAIGAAYAQIMDSIYGKELTLDGLLSSTELLEECLLPNCPAKASTLNDEPSLFFF